MACEISKEDSKNPTKVMDAIKKEWRVNANLNSWIKIEGWKKPGDNWYNLVMDNVPIEIKTAHVSKPSHRYTVTFEGVPKSGNQVLRVDVGSLPFTMPEPTFRGT